MNVKGEIILDIVVLKKFIEVIITERPECCTQLYFSRKTSTKYITHAPSASNEVQYQIIDTVLPCLLELLENNQAVEYNPIGVADNEIEILKSDTIPNFSKFIDSVSDNNIYKEMSDIKLEKIGFYCFHIKYEDDEVYLFRQFSKLKKLRSGLIGQFFNDELTILENQEFLGIDSYIDSICFNGDLLVLNHISLERIFDYKDEFLKKTNEAIAAIKEKDKFVNVEQFADDCCRDVRITKRFTHLMSKCRLPLFFEHYDKVCEIVSELELDIDFDNTGKLIYRDKSQLYHIVALLSDSYFRALLSNRTGIAKMEEEICTC